MNTLITKYKQIVIGSTIEALLYSFLNKCPYLHINNSIPHEFDLFNDEEITLLKQLFDIEQLSKRELWYELLLITGFNGYKLMPGECSSIIINNNTLKAYTSNARMSTFEFEKLIIFDDENILGLPDVIDNNDLKYKVYDYLKVNKTCLKPFTHIKTDDDLVN